MTMSDEKMDRIISAAGEHYNAPGETPREEMWEVIAAETGGGERCDPRASGRRDRSGGGAAKADVADSTSRGLVSRAANQWPLLINSTTNTMTP